MPNIISINHNNVDLYLSSRSSTTTTINHSISSFNDNELNDEFLLVNIEDYKIVYDDDLATKVKWSPYSGMRLTGFPKYIFRNKCLFDLDLI